MVLLLNDEEVIEGMIGGLASVLGVIYYKNAYKDDENIIVLSIIGWMIIWFIRKVLMRLYREFKKYNQAHFEKKKYGLQVKNIFNIPNLIYHSLLILVLFVISYFGLIHYSSIDDTLKSLDKYSLYHISPIFIILIMTFFK